MNATGEKPQGVDMVLGKPTSLEGLRQAVQQLLAGGHGAAISPAIDRGGR